MTLPVTAEANQGFLSFLHEDELAVVLDHTQARMYKTGEYAVREGELDRSFFIISRGSFEVLVHTRRRRRRARVLERGNLFGEVAFFDGRPRSADVVALEDSEALILTPAAFERLRLAHPRLALCFVLDLGRILSERFRASDALAGAGDR
jgi:CRP-like cAMP-binding protein